MNIFNDSRFRFSAILFLAILQVVSVTDFVKPYFQDLFYFVNLAYFVLGFLSINWRQAIINIGFVTLPVVVLMTLLMLIVTLLGGRISDIWVTLEVS